VPNASEGRRAEAAMPFRHNAFDPETIEVLTAALEEAWELLQTRRRIYGGHENARTALATHVMAAAMEGERDVKRLSERALAAFEAGLTRPPKR
jgi:hypothetical protein